MSNTVWNRAKTNLPVGTIIDDKYRVREVTEKVIILARIASGKTVRVSRKMVESTHARLIAGETLTKQASAPKGGISFTIAVEAGVVAALGSLIRYQPGPNGRGGVFVRSRAGGAIPSFKQVRAG